jgi:hypothetical protein
MAKPEQMKPEAAPKPEVPEPPKKIEDEAKQKKKRTVSDIQEDKAKAAAEAGKKKQAEIEAKKKEQDDKKNIEADAKQKVEEETKQKALETDKAKADKMKPEAAPKLEAASRPEAAPKPEAASKPEVPEPPKKPKDEAKQKKKRTVSDIQDDKKKSKVEKSKQVSDELQLDTQDKPRPNRFRIFTEKILDKDGEVHLEIEFTSNVRSKFSLEKEAEKAIIQVLLADPIHEKSKYTFLFIIPNFI